VKHALLIGYHEASRPGALALRPIGRCAHDYNRTRFTCPPPARGPPFLIMSSRGRVDPPTSAVDVAMRSGAAVLSPVTGVVLSVKAYRLYGAYPDVEITLGADGIPGLRVLLIHIDRVKVRRGDFVVAGRTPLGRPRRFPFGSQVNDYVGVGIPHVHIEVKRRGT
jgi:murein DD-endopeptidase MepM/ murein hydrolase activator NlpD